MSTISILIVEDEAIVAADLAGKVRQLGYDVAGITVTGEEAIELARSLRPALVLMDIRLAGAIDGIAAAELIHRECHLPVLFLTAHSDTGTVERARQAEAFGYILKPFDERDLHIQIEMALYKHAAEENLRQSAAELQAANIKLRNSRVAALNMMEDADSALRQAEEASLELQREAAVRKQTEEELRKSRERLDLALASSSMATFDWDIIKNTRTWSDGVHALLGTRPETFTGAAEEFFRIIHPEDRSSVQAALDRAVETIGVYETEYRAVWPDGCIRHISARGKVHSDDAGRAVLLTGVCWDITEQKHAEVRLLAQARTLKALNSGNHALLHATDELALLQAVCKIVVEDCGHAMVWIGYAEEDQEKSVRPVAYSGFEEGYLESLKITWNDTERGRGPTGTAIRTGKPCGCADMLSDPAFEPWRDQALKRGYGSSLVLPIMGDGKVFGAITIYSSKPHSFHAEEMALLMQLADELAYGIRTVRLRVAHDQAYEDLRRARDEWELTFNSVPDLIAILNDRHQVVRVNKAMAGRLGREPGECVGMPCYEAVHGSNIPPEFCPHSQSLDDGEEHNVEVHEERLGGDFLVSTTPLLDPQGRMTGTVHVARDITARKRFEEELRRAYDEMEKRVEERTAELRDKDQMLLLQSRQAAMGEMIGNIAHQWRQPLNTLGLTIQQLPLLYDLGKIDRDLLNQCVSSSMGLIQHMSRTIDDFRNYFRPDKEKIEFNVHDATVHTLSLLEGTLQSPQIDITIVEKNDPVIYGYQNEFSQVLLNILMNARDALLERNIADPRVTITICSEDGRAVVTIADSAGGISADIIDKIFDPYFTTKGPQQGTGVGLFMSKTIIEKNMGGRLSVRNNAHGAEFRIEVGNENTI